MNKLSKCVFIFLFVFDKHNVGICIAWTVFVFDKLSGCKDSGILLLPVFLLQRLNLFILVIQILRLIFDCDFNSVIVVNSACILLVAWKFGLTSVDAFTSAQRDFDLIKRSNFIILSFVLDWLYSLVFEGPLIKRHVSHTFYLDILLFSRIF